MSADPTSASPLPQDAVGDLLAACSSFLKLPQGVKEEPALMTRLTEKLTAYRKHLLTWRLPGNDDLLAYRSMAAARKVIEGGGPEAVVELANICRANEAAGSSTSGSALEVTVFALATGLLQMTCMLEPHAEPLECLLDIRPRLLSLQRKSALSFARYAMCIQGALLCSVSPSTALAASVQHELNALRPGGSNADAVVVRICELFPPTDCSGFLLLVKLKPLLVSQLRGVRLVVESGLLAKGLTDLGPLHCRLVCELLGTLDLLIASVHTACALGAGAIPANVRASIDELATSVLPGLAHDTAILRDCATASSLLSRGDLTGIQSDRLAPQVQPTAQQATPVVEEQAGSIEQQAAAQLAEESLARFERSSAGAADAPSAGAALEPHPAPRVCAASGCGATRGLKLCAGCRAVRYCSLECSKAHWREHRQECRRIQAERQE